MPGYGDQFDSEQRKDRVFSRRTVLAAVPGIAIMAAGVSCGSDDDPDDESADPAPTATTESQSENEPTATSDTTSEPTEADSEPTASSDTDSATGEWSFTDDRGVTITLPHAPERVVAYLPMAASLWDFGVRPVGVFGTTRRADGTPEVYAGNVDLDAIASLGEVYGELDLEQLVELKPDLILFDMYWEEIDLWGLPADAIAQVEEIAPIFGVSFINQPITDTVGTLERLAVECGADLEAPVVVEARKRFDAAAEAVQAACAAKTDLTTLFVAGWTDNLYVANPLVWADLIYFQELGLNITVPEIEPSELWETLSWEQAGKYPVDLILNDARSGEVTLEDLKSIATWAAHPAVQADQVGPWYTEFVPSYAGLANVLEELATSIEACDEGVV